MASKKVTLKLRMDTYDNFVSADPVLKAGEPAFCSDTGDIYIGDGNSTFSALEPSFITNIVKPTAQWASDNKVYKAGKFLIDNTLRTVRLADGSSSYAQLDEFPGIIGGGNASNE